MIWVFGEFNNIEKISIVSVNKLYVYIYYACSHNKPGRKEK